MCTGREKITAAETRRDLYLREINARELVQRQQRAAAWTLQNQRAKGTRGKAVAFRPHNRDL
jgi:hypothetical protein